MLNGLYVNSPLSSIDSTDALKYVKSRYNGFNIESKFEILFKL